MAIVERVEGSEWLVVWKRDSDARIGQVRVVQPEGRAITADCRACNATARLLLPLGEAADGSCDVTLELRAEKASQARPIEWIALAQGPSQADLGIVKKLENLPALVAEGRKWNWSFSRAEWPAAKDPLYLVLQIAPRSQPVRMEAESRPPAAASMVVMPEAAAAPAVVEPLAAEVATAPLDVFSWAEEPPLADPPPPAAPVPPEPPAPLVTPLLAEPPLAEPPLAEAEPGPAQRRRVRSLMGGASVVFRSAADALACAITIEDAGSGIIHLDPSRCEKDVRVIVPLRPLAVPEGLPPGLCLPFGLGLKAAELGPREKRTLLWLGVTQGASPLSLEMHLLLAKRIRAGAQLQPMSWHGGLDPRVEAGATLYATLQLAGGGTPVRFTLPAPVPAPSGGTWLEGDGLLAELAEGGPPGRIALHRDGQMLHPAAQPQAGAGGEALLGVPPAEISRMLDAAGWADGARVEALLLAGDTLLARRELRVALAPEEGGLIAATPEAIRGWAAMPGQPAQSLRVDVMVQGEAYLTRAVAGEFETRLLLGTQPDGELIELRSHLTGRPLGEAQRLIGLPRRVVDQARALRATQGLRERPPAITIIVPLRDGDEAAPRCLAALAAHTPAAARIILVDHGCTSPALIALLAERDGHQRLRATGGRAEACNQGIAAAGSDDVVLLMPDAEPGPRWLQRLLFAAQAGDKLGSVSALPAEAALRAMPLWTRWGAEDAQRLVAQGAGGLLPEIPVMQGACLYLRRAALREVGPFDAAGFPEGQGWQEDWAMRARYLGYAHVMEDGCLVGVSPAPPIPAEAEALLGHRYAELPQLRRAAEADPAWRTVTHRLAVMARDALAAGHRPKPRWLFALAPTGAGQEVADLALIGALAGHAEPLLLRCLGQEMRLSRLADGVELVLATHRLPQPISLLAHRCAAYDAVVAEWMQGEAVEGLHVRHLAGHSLGLIERARLLGIPVILALHDLYPACPNAALRDPQGQDCGGICTEGAGDCSAAFWPPETVPPLRDRWVHNWRAILGPVLAQADAFILPSEAARAALLRSFPALEGRRFEVIGRPSAATRAAPIAPPAPRPGEKLRVLLAGHGQALAELQGALSALDQDGRLELQPLGEAQPDGLASKPHLAAILTPEGEDALPQLWSAGLPVLGLEASAVGSTIREAGGGWVLGEATPKAIYRALRRIAGDIEGHAARVAAVEAWRHSAGAGADSPALAESLAALHALVRSAGRAG